MHPSKVVKPGRSGEAVVLEVHSKDRRISLGLKQLEPNPWTTIDTRYSVGSVVEGRVRNMTDFGAFIEIEEGIDGLVHVSDLSWTKRVAAPLRDTEEGASGPGRDSQYRFVGPPAFPSASAAPTDAWESYFQNHQVGDTVHGRDLPAGEILAVSVELRRRGGRLVPFLRGAGPIRAGAGRGGIHRWRWSDQEFDFKIVKMSERRKRSG